MLGQKVGLLLFGRHVVDLDDAVFAHLLHVALRVEVVPRGASDTVRLGCVDGALVVAEDVDWASLQPQVRLTELLSATTDRGNRSC